MGHILLEKMSFCKPSRKREMNEDFSFDKLEGFWKDSEGISLIANPSVAKPRTKKEDVETGEDRKGA